MANLRRIEELVSKVGREPDFVRGYKPRDCHLSGALREMEERMNDPDISLDDIELPIRELLNEAAETLDDAHQDWLELVNVLFVRTIATIASQSVGVS